MLIEIYLTVVSLFLVFFYIVNECRRPPKYPPGPPWLPFMGSLPELKNLSRTLGGQHFAFDELSRKYNTNVIGLKLGKDKFVCACSFESVRTVLTSAEYEGRPDNFFFRLRSMGTRKGITGTDGDLWKQQRTFVVTHLRALGFGKDTVEDMVKQEIKDVMGRIENNLEDVDVAALLAPSVLNILWVLTSGRSLRDNKQINQLLKLIILRSKAFDMSGGILNNYPWLRYFMPEITGYNLVQKLNFELTDFIMESINEHKEKLQEDEEMRDDLIFSFLTEMKKKENNISYFTDDQLIMVCLDIFIAGSTTTSNTINFALLAMILYPEVQERVQKCLDEAFDLHKDISYCDKQRVPYVEAVLLECQRVFPVVPITGPRRVLRKTTLDGYIIPKNSTVLLNLHSIHNDKEFWKDPEVFRPERFLDKEGKLVAQDRILTFGLGKRRCLGDALAKTCIFLFFATILMKFRIEVKAGTRRPSGKPVPGITMTPEKYRAKFTPRS